MSSPTVKTAVLAFALSSWVEGLTQLRTVLVAPAFRRDDEEDTLEPLALPADATWKERIIAWFNRPGRPDVDIDDRERATLALVDTSTAFVILQLLGQPLLPFLLSPFLTTFPLPRSTSDSKSVKWSRLILTTLLLSFVHEAQRVSVSLGLETLRKRREAKTRALLGDVYVKGDELRLRKPQDDDEDDEECLICAGVGADNPLSHSISSLSSMNTSASIDILGPLEAFCANAPQKHIAHRSCFLSWHAAYRQQRRHLLPEQILLQHSNQTEETRRRAQVILEAAGFSHLSRLLKFPHELPWSHVLLPTSRTETGALVRPVLTLTEYQAGSSSLPSNAHRSLATLHTTAPPCPGCRSSVLLHFFTRPIPPRRSRHELNYKEALKTLTRLWMHHWSRLVTGKTVLYRLASQWSFVMALLSMLRVSHGSMRYTYTP